MQNGDSVWVVVGERNVPYVGEYTFLVLAFKDGGEAFDYAKSMDKQDKDPYTSYTAYELDLR